MRKFLVFLIATVTLSGILALVLVPAATGDHSSECPAGYPRATHGTNNNDNETLNPPTINARCHDVLAGNDHTIFNCGDQFTVDDDAWFGRSGQDTVEHKCGADWSMGGDGADTHYGGSGNDNLYGGNGDDLLSGDGGHDNLYDGAGADFVHGGAGTDTWFKCADNETEASTLSIEIELGPDPDYCSPP